MLVWGEVILLINDKLAMSMLAVWPALNLGDQRSEIMRAGMSWWRAVEYMCCLSVGTRLNWTGTPESLTIAFLLHFDLPVAHNDGTAIGWLIECSALVSIATPHLTPLALSLARSNRKSPLFTAQCLSEPLIRGASELLWHVTWLHWKYCTCWKTVVPFLCKYVEMISIISFVGFFSPQANFTDRASSVCRLILL
jgi:hypothetical protein